MKNQIYTNKTHFYLHFPQFFCTFVRPFNIRTERIAFDTFLKVYYECLSFDDR